MLIFSIRNLVAHQAGVRGLQEFTKIRSKKPDELQKLRQEIFRFYQIIPDRSLKFPLASRKTPKYVSSTIDGWMVRESFLHREGSGKYIGLLNICCHDPEQ